MRRALLTLALLLCLATQAHAQGGGWSQNCPSKCVGAEAWWIMPTSTYVSAVGGQQAFTIWIGIQGPNNQLLQFGIQQVWANSSTLDAPRAFWELAPSIPSRFIPTGDFAPGVGDLIHAVMACTANCTPNNASQTWTMTLTDYPAGGGSSFSCAIHAVTSPDCSGGSYTPSPVVNNVEALYVVEMNGSAESPNFTPLRWSGLKYDPGTGLTPIAVTSYGQIQGAHDYSGANEQCSQGSWPIGVNGNDGNSCWSLCTNGNAPLCPAQPYTGATPFYGQ